MTAFPAVVISGCIGLRVLRQIESVRVHGAALGPVAGSPGLPWEPLGLGEGAHEDLLEAFCSTPLPRLKIANGDDEFGRWRQIAIEQPEIGNLRTSTLMFGSLCRHSPLQIHNGSRANRHALTHESASRAVPLGASRTNGPDPQSRKQSDALDVFRCAKHNVAMSLPELPKFQSAINAGLTARLHIGAQAHVILRGNVVAGVALGESRPGVGMTTDTLMLWLSATKPITAVAIAQLWERGQIGLDDSVSLHVPAFAANGKEAITIRHLLTHTAGIRGAANNFTRDNWETTIDRICNAKIEPGWVPGAKAGYHLASSWFLLGEIVRLVDGRRFENYVREEIFLPLGMVDSWVGMPIDRYAEYGDRIGIMQNTDPAAKLPHAWDTPEAAALCKPGGNGRGPIRELARFYQMLLNGGSLDGARIISPQTVEALTARHRVGMYDHTFKHIMDWSLGFIVNNNQYGVDTVRYGYGPHASWRTYGHSGNQSSVAFADPKHGLVAAIVFNGTPGDAAHDVRVRAVLSGLYEDLGLEAPNPKTQAPIKSQTPSSYSEA